MEDNHWGENTKAHLYTLKNRQGMTVELSNYGGTITKLLVPDKNGLLKDVVLGYNSMSQQKQNKNYFGCIVGRFANRIANGRFSLFGQNYVLPTNNYPNGQACCLHGGISGFDDKYYGTQMLYNKEKDEAGIQFQYKSQDGEEGFPGNLNLAVNYWLSNTNALRIEYKAEVKDKPTVINLTNHSYFNLHGEGEKDVLDQFLQINSNNITPVNKGLIPTGEFMDVTNTAFDFRDYKKIGQDINSTTDEQIQITGGYDHNFVLKQKNDNKLQLAATAFSKITGIVLEVLTTEPGVQLYTTNTIKPDLYGKSGKLYGKYAGFCLETQHFPDSPNQQDIFPSVVLKPGEFFNSTTIFQFGVLI